MTIPNFLSQFSDAQLTAIYNHCRELDIQKNGGDVEEYDAEAASYVKTQFSYSRASEAVKLAWYAAFTLFPAHRTEVEAKAAYSKLRAVAAKV